MEIIINTTNRTEGLVAAHVRRIAKATGSACMAVSKAMLIEAAKEQMRKGVCHFVYRKKDGTIREAFGLPRCRQGRSEKFPVGKSDSGAFMMTANFREEFDASP